MPNNLTGNYEAIVQVSVRQINGLLATLHQRGGNPAASPKFLHSESFRVGDAPAAMHPGVEVFKNWLVSEQKSYQLVPAAAGKWTADFDKAPPGMVRWLADAVGNWNDAMLEDVPADSVRGRVQVQISAPTISFEPGTSQIWASLFIRARYFPDPGSQHLPSKVHGEVRVRYQVLVKDDGPGKKELDVPVPPQDSDIQFLDLSPMSPAERTTITKQVRKALRKTFKPMSVPLPDDFKFVEFKSVGTSADQALALPVQLSPGNPPVGGLSSFTENLLADNDFAIAVGRDHVVSRFQTTLNQLLQFTTSFEVPIDGWWDPTYHFSVSSANLQFKVGSIDLVVAGKATTRAWGFSNYDNIVITQPLTIGFSGQDVVLLAPDSALDISGLPDDDDAKAQARNRIIAERNSRLPNAQLELNAALNNARSILNTGLMRFDPATSANYASIQITPDGIIVRGTIDTPANARNPPVVSIRPTTSFESVLPSFTALESWIPGGRITNYSWSLFELVTIELDPPSSIVGVPSKLKITIPWEGKSQTFPDDPHGFIFEHPEKITALSSACLRIDGSQTSPDGYVTNDVSGYGRTGACRPAKTQPLNGLPPGIEDLLGPIYLPPDVWSPDAVLAESIYGHVSVSAADASDVGINHLVYFADWSAEQPLEALGRGLRHISGRGHSHAVFVVLPVGSLSVSRRDVEARLGLRGLRTMSRQREPVETPEREAPVPFRVTEDYGGAWTRTFDVRNAPATFLVNARGEYVWSEQGELHPERLAAAMDEHAVRSPAPQHRLMTLAVELGETVPDVSFADVEGRSIALRRLRGRSVLLSFWRSGLQPCVSELRRLQDLNDRGSERPFIVALCADLQPDAIAEVRQQHQLTFSLVHDTYRGIGRLFGVTCWPTTVSINRDGIVDHIQFGMAPPKVRRVAASAT